MPSASATMRGSSCWVISLRRVARRSFVVTPARWTRSLASAVEQGPSGRRALLVDAQDGTDVSLALPDLHVPRRINQDELALPGEGEEGLGNGQLAEGVPGQEAVNVVGRHRCPVLQSTSGQVPGEVNQDLEL